MMTQDEIYDQVDRTCRLCLRCGIDEAYERLRFNEIVDQPKLLEYLKLALPYVQDRLKQTDLF